MVTIVDNDEAMALDFGRLQLPYQSRRSIRDRLAVLIEKHPCWSSGHYHGGAAAGAAPLYTLYPNPTRKRTEGMSRNGEPQERSIMPKILLVEDKRNEIGTLLSRRLQRKGYSVISAHDGEQGHLMACSEMPDLILDGHKSLPLMNGWEVSK